MTNLYERFMQLVVAPYFDGDGWKGWLVIFNILAWVITLVGIGAFIIAVLWVAKQLGVL